MTSFFLAVRLFHDALHNDPPQKSSTTDPQTFAAACGISTGLLAQLQAFVSNGSLATLTFPAPVPGAPTTVLGLATETNEHFCEAAHE